MQSSTFIWPLIFSPNGRHRSDRIHRRFGAAVRSQVERFPLQHSEFVQTPERRIRFHWCYHCLRRVLVRGPQGRALRVQSVFSFIAQGEIDLQHFTNDFRIRASYVTKCEKTKIFSWAKNKLEAQNCWFLDMDVGIFCLVPLRMSYCQWLYVFKMAKHEDGPIFYLCGYLYVRSSYLFSPAREREKKENWKYPQARIS